MSLNQSPDAEVFLSSPLGENYIVEFGADTVTLATGSRWRQDGVGSTRLTPLFAVEDRVYSPDDVMDNQLDEPKSTFIVYDDDYTVGVIVERLSKLGHVEKTKQLFPRLLVRPNPLKPDQERREVVSASPA